MKSDKELLQIMLDNKQHFCYDLFHWAANLYYYDIITESEYIRLDTYIFKNEPKFTWYRFFHPWDTIYRWPKDDINPRIKWIETQLKKLKL